MKKLQERRSMCDIFKMLEGDKKRRHMRVYRKKMKKKIRKKWVRMWGVKRLRENGRWGKKGKKL